MIICSCCHKPKPMQAFSNSHKECNPCRAWKERLKADAAKREQFHALVSWPPPRVQ